MLRVVAHLESPLCGSAPHLDALLITVAAQIHGRQNAGLRRDAPLAEVDVHIPMTHRRIGGFNVAECSSPIYQAGTVWREHVAKRLAVENSDLLADNQRLVVATGNATYKSYRLPVMLQSVERVVWLCRGHRRPILQYLRYVRSIGEKRRMGFGRVRKWEAEYIDGESWWYAPSASGTVLMRPLPLCDDLPADLLGVRRDFGACVPPYWHSDRYCELVTPT